MALVMALAGFGDGVGDFGDAVVGDGVGDVGDDVVGDGFGEVGVGILVGAYVGAGVGVGAGAPGDVRAASSTEESRCVRVTTRRSDWARAAQSSHARFPIDIIGPLLREGTLSVGCSCRTLEERSLNGGFRRVVAWWWRLSVTVYVGDGALLGDGLGERSALM